MVETRAAQRELTPRYRGIMFLLRVWSLLLWPLRIRERGRLPVVGGALIVANHGSVLDITGLALAGLPRHVSFVARRSLSDSKFLDSVMRASEAILVEPGSSDRAALRQIVERLEAGRLVAIFPEGTRTPDGSLHPFKGGAILAARKAGVPIVPAGVRGAFEAWPRGRKFPRRGVVEIQFGDPLEPDSPELAERLEQAVAELAGIPRLRSGALVDA